MGQTSLGYVSGAGLTFSCKNTGATAIPIGAVVSLKSYVAADSATAPTPIGAEQIVVEVELAGTPTKYCGIATTPMGINYGGAFIACGFTLCMTTSAAVVALNALKVASSDYMLVDSGGTGTLAALSLSPNHTAFTTPDYGANTQKYVNAWVFFLTANFGYS